MNDNNPVPFLDLITPHAELEAELTDVFLAALRSAHFIGGQEVTLFEQEFADFCGVRHSVGAGSGTDALRFALIAAGVQPGDTVVTVPNTFIATTEAITQAGGRPEFVDVEPDTSTLDPRELRAYLESQCTRDPATGRAISRQTGRRVAAIVPVHLYGQMADMDPILDLARQCDAAVVEDACQAHGAEYFSARENRWCRAGSMGRAAAFSFYPGKNLGACGEAGAVTTNDADVAERCRMLRDHGQSKKYIHDIEGYNGRLDALQAGILRVKLRRLAEWNLKRRECARRYNELFDELAPAVAVPFEPPNRRAVYHLYVVRVEDRAGLQAHLAQHGIGTQIHYPTPLHLQQAYASLGYQRGDFPAAESACGAIVSLPLYPNLEARDQRRVVEHISRFVADDSAAAVTTGAAAAGR